MTEHAERDRSVGFMTGAEFRELYGDAGLKRQVQGDVSAAQGRTGSPAGWSDAHLQACVERAYRRGVQDTLSAIVTSLAELRQGPPSTEEVLSLTHGLLAQEAPCV